MASGIQTIANEGLHMQPYFVEYIDDARGERVYTHNDPGTPVLDRQVALTAIDVHEGRAHRRHGARASWPISPAASRRSARPARRRRTGRRSSSGPRRSCRRRCSCATPTATRRWRVSPSSPTAGVDRVQGGTFPARIWGSMMDAIGLERVGLDADWEHPGPPARPPARLYLPGNECVYEVVAYEPSDTEPEASSAHGRARRRSRRRATGGHPARRPRPRTPQPPGPAPAPATGDGAAADHDDRTIDTRLREQSPSRSRLRRRRRRGRSCRRPRPALPSRPMCSTLSLRCPRYRSTASCGAAPSVTP